MTIAARLLIAAGVALMPLRGTAVYGAEADPAAGAIGGQLATSDGHAVAIGDAVVFLLDGESGMPLSPETRRPLDVQSPEALERLAAFDEYWHAVTDQQGAFRFDGVPPGTYRLVAQSWGGVAGMARGKPKSLRTDPGDEPTGNLLLHGVAANVVVQPGQETAATCQRLGDGVLHLVTDPEEPHNYVLLSQSEPLGPPVLGPVAWGPKFIAGVAGITRMETGRLVVEGLPEGRMIHVGLLNYDNSVGLGGGSYQVDAITEVRLPIYAGWSNGKKDPSPELMELTELLETRNLKSQTLISLPPDLKPSEYVAWVWRHAHDVVEIEGFGEARIIDVLAADAYRQLRKFDRARRSPAS